MSPWRRAGRSLRDRTFRSLGTRNFRLYFIGQAISGTGSWMQMVGQSWLVLRLTHSGVALGLTLALQFTPVLVAGAWSGVLVDRLDKRRLLMTTSAASGLVALALGAVTAAGVVEVWMVYAFAFALGTVTAIDNPARRAFVPELVETDDVANAVGLNSTVFTAARIVGPALAAGAIAGVGIASCFFLNAASYVAVIWALGAMRTGELRPSIPVAPARRQLRDGLAYAWHNRPVRLALGMTTVIGTLALNYQVVMPLMARREFDGDAGTYGLLMAVLGVGSLVGALSVAHLARASIRVLIASAFALGVSMTLAALAPNLAFELVVLPFSGASAMVLLAMATAVLNAETDPAFRGRVMALFAVAFLGSTPLGGPLVGWIAQVFGPRAGIAIGAVASLATAAGAMAFTTSPSTRSRGLVTGIGHRPG